MLIPACCFTKAPISLLAMAAVVLLGSSCSNSTDSNGGQPPGGTTRMVASLEGAVSNVQIQAGQTKEFVYTLQIPPEFTSISAMEVDLAGTLQHVRLEGVPKFPLLARALASTLRQGGETSAVAFIRVGNDRATVCAEGISYGPFNFTYTTALQVSPETSPADAPTLQIINAGSMVFCLSITPTVDATFSVDSLEINVTQQDCPAPDNFAGEWVGTYDCGNSCTGFPFGGPSQLVVSQDGTSATYTDDGGETFTGTICGNLFRFELRDTNSLERGTLTLHDANTATKRSTWRTTFEPYCGGDCIDQLTRVSPVGTR